MSYSWFLKIFVINDLLENDKSISKTNALVALVLLKPLFKIEKLKMTKPCRWRAQCPTAKQRKYSFRWSCPAKPWKSHLLILWSKSGHINHLMFQRFLSLWYFASLETSLLPLWFAVAEALQISGSAFWWWRTLRGFKVLELTWVPSMKLSSLRSPILQHTTLIFAGILINW